MFTFSILISTFFLSGCLFTLYPIFTEKDVVYTQQLLGSWKFMTNENKVERMDITKINESDVKQLTGSIKNIAHKGYLITNKNEQEIIVGNHLVFLVKIGKYHYLDYYPLEIPEDKKHPEFFRMHYMKMHIFYRIDFKSSKILELKRFDDAFLKQLIEKKQIRIRLEERPYRLPAVITASTEELQQYILKYSNVQEAYTKESSFTCTKID